MDSLHACAGCLACTGPTRSSRRSGGKGQRESAGYHRLPRRCCKVSLPSTGVRISLRRCRSSFAQAQPFHHMVEPCPENQAPSAWPELPMDWPCRFLQISIRRSLHASCRVVGTIFLGIPLIPYRYQSSLSRLRLDSHHIRHNSSSSDRQLCAGSAHILQGYHRPACRTRRLSVSS